MNETSQLPREDRLRAADADRDRAIEVLAGAAAEGRLTQEEYSERSETALSARTLGELAALTAGIEVRMSGRAVPGAKSSQLRRAPHTGAPVIEVRCDVLLGSVTVRRPTGY